jgi:hypothetical protein
MLEGRRVQIALGPAQVSFPGPTFLPFRLSFASFAYMPVSCHYAVGICPRSPQLSEPKNTPPPDRSPPEEGSWNPRRGGAAPASGISFPSVCFLLPCRDCPYQPNSFTLSLECKYQGQHGCRGPCGNRPFTQRLPFDRCTLLPSLPLAFGMFPFFVATRFIGLIKGLPPLMDLGT